MLQWLPDNVIYKICQYLSYKELSRLSEVCKSMSKIATHPKLWSRYNISQHFVVQQLQDFLSSRRFSLLNNIEIKKEVSTNFSEDNLLRLFLYFKENRCLLNLRLSNINVSYIPGYPLACSILHVRKLTLENCHLTTEQVTCLLRELTKVSMLDELNLANNCLQFVPPELFSKLHQKCWNINLSLTDATHLQITELLRNLNAESRLKSLDLSDLTLTEVSLSILLNMLSSLSSITLSGCVLPPNALLEMFKYIAEQDISLQLLDISGVSVSDIEAVILSAASCHVTRLKLANTWLSHLQFSTILNRLTDTCVQIKELDVCGNRGLSEVTTEELLQASLCISTLNMSSCELLQHVLFDFIQVQEQEDDGFKLVLFGGDYPVAGVRRALDAAHCIHLNKVDVPIYIDEKSCFYSIDNTEPLSCS